VGGIAFADATVVRVNTKRFELNAAASSRRDTDTIIFVHLSTPLVDPWRRDDVPQRPPQHTLRQQNVLAGGSHSRHSALSRTALAAIPSRLDHATFPGYERLPFWWPGWRTLPLSGLRCTPPPRVTCMANQRAAENTFVPALLTRKITSSAHALTLNLYFLTAARR